MIVNLNLQNKKVVVVGAGKEALKRINSLKDQNCQITVIGDKISNEVTNLEKMKKIKIEKQKVSNLDFLSKERPDMVISTTNDKNLNKKIIKKAKRKKIITYSSDNPEESDFSNPAVINYKEIIQIAIFTGGKSPIMSKKLKNSIERALPKIISKQDIVQIKVQQIARKLAKSEIEDQVKRKKFLSNIMSDEAIKQLIKDNQTKKVEKYIITTLKDWK